LRAVLVSQKKVNKSKVVPENRRIFMMDIDIEVNNNFWKRFDHNYYIRGAACVNGEVKNETELYQYIKSVNTYNELIEKLNNMNGFYAIIINLNDKIFAVADRVRSIPLFYHFDDNKLIISDNADYIDEQFKNEEFDTISIAEFLLTGYVTGPCTFKPTISQLRAGEAIEINKTTGSLNSYKYYKFIPENKLSYKRKLDIQLIDELDSVVVECNQNLIHFANGKRIIIPLSGGLDSRLIAITLKRLGYDDVIAFSYGRPGNLESQISNNIARTLKIPWYFVEYNENLWKVWYNSKEFFDYIIFSQNLASLPHIQDFPAIMELKKRKLIDDNDIVVPGHTGDFVQGGHIPFEILAYKNLDANEVMEEVWKNHYVLNSINIVSEFLNSDSLNIENKLKSKIADIINDVNIDTLEKGIGGYEYWDWQERQAKFIVNSVRVYDFWGLKWWLPWWDKIYLDYWVKIPLLYRFKRKLAEEYMRIIQSNLGIEERVYEGFSKKMKKSMLKFLVRQRMSFPDLFIFFNALKFLNNYHPSKSNFPKDYYTHPLAWYGIVSFEKYKKLISQAPITHVNTILVCDIFEQRLKNN